MNEVYYTLICNKEESDDYCRGHLVETYFSDFQWISTPDKEKLLELWTECEYTNLRLSYNETGYDMFFLVNGRPDDSSPLFEELRSKAQARAQIRKQQREEKEAQEKIEREKRSKEAEEQRERERYLELKEKYGEGK